VSPVGERLITSGEEAEELREIEIDHLAARNKSILSLNNLFSDRRPEMYGQEAREQGKGVPLFTDYRK